MQIRDWLYVEDHAAAIWLVLQKGRVGETYNIGGLNEKPNLEIVKTICALLDAKAPRADGKSYFTQVTYVADRPGHDRRYAIDCQKLQGELGWAPKENFTSGIAKTVDWYLAHRSWAADITAKKYARERLGTAK
jgi:dTDP-glucose 4,6-dehydratase